MKAGKETPLLIIQVSGFTINPTLGHIVDRDGRRLFLEPRLLKLLHALVSNKDGIITRDELIESVWSDVIVNEESLTKAIFDLRRFFKDSMEESLEIKTIRKIGYRLIIKDGDIKVTANYRKTISKAALYLFIAFVLFVLFVRAIRYSN